MFLLYVMANNVNKILIESGVFQVKETHFSCGIESPVYVDCRKLVSLPDYRANIIEEFNKIINDIKPDYVAGVALAGIPWASYVSSDLKLPMVYIRKEAKSHGERRLIEGDFKENKTYCVIEDVITTAGSALIACEEIKKAGGQVIGCVSIFSYIEDEVKQIFKDKNIIFKSLTNLEKVLDVTQINDKKMEEINNLVKELKEKIS